MFFENGYPFGMMMVGRAYNPALYRFGFNGKEKVNEIDGVGNNIDFGARVYDSRLGRFLSVDPETRKYPQWSPYIFAADNPIFLIDFGGKGPEISIANVKKSFEGFQGDKFYITIYIEQVNANTRDHWKPVISEASIDVGHTAIKLTKISTTEKIIREKAIGFYPKNKNDIRPQEDRKKTTSGGVFRDNEGASYNVAVKIEVTEQRFNAVVNYLQSIETKKLKYDADNLNCTDVGLKAAEIADVNLPQGKGEINLPVYGNVFKSSNPADLGQDIIEQKDAIEKKAPSKIQVSTQQGTILTKNVGDLKPAGDAKPIKK